ncbi:MAG: ribosome-binding factor A [Patescibacteria group bacterium]|jgi:ribosome-binding factor A
MPVDRLRQINELLRTELAREFRAVLELPTNVVVSITKVRTAKDLHTATIYLSILPDNYTGTALALIHKNFSRIIEQAIPRIKIRCVPKFRILLDETERKAAHIEKLLDSLK